MNDNNIKERNDRRDDLPVEYEEESGSEQVEQEQVVLAEDIPSRIRA